jgi:hypothetical protein
MHGLIFETSICYWQDQPGSLCGARGARRRPLDGARGATRVHDRPRAPASEDEESAASKRTIAFNRRRRPAVSSPSESDSSTGQSLVRVSKETRLFVATLTAFAVRRVRVGTRLLDYRRNGQRLVRLTADELQSSPVRETTRQTAGMYAGAKRALRVIARRADSKPPG